jgi:uncharacterized protein (TIGR00266 family)
METAGIRPIEFEILHSGDSPILRAFIPQNRSLFADAGAMLSMTPGIGIDSSLKGGILGGLARKFLRGETFFFLTMKAENGDGESLLAPPAPGEILLLDLDGATEYFVQKGGFLAAENTVRLETKTQNLSQGLFSGEGFFITRMAGHGKLALSSFGAIHRVDLPAGQEYVVDNGHLVAWTATTAYRVSKASSHGWISSIFAGEGIVCRFTGPGTIYVQSRNPKAFAGWLTGYLPTRGG